MSTSNSGASAFNAAVRTGDPDDAAQEARTQRAAELAATVRAVAAKWKYEQEPKRKAALRAALAAAEAQADQARAEALKGSE